jgi:hypothetical protein
MLNFHSPVPGPSLPSDIRLSGFQPCRHITRHPAVPDHCSPALLHDISCCPSRVTYHPAPPVCCVISPLPCAESSHPSRTCSPVPPDAQRLMVYMPDIARRLYVPLLLSRQCHYQPPPATVNGVIRVIVQAPA